MKSDRIARLSQLASHMRVDSNKDHVIKRFLPLVILLGLGVLGYYLYPLHDENLSPAERLRHDSVSDQETPIPFSDKKTDKRDGTNEKTTPAQRKTAAPPPLQKTGEKRSPTQSERATTAPATLPDVKDETLLINRSGVFVKRLFHLAGKGNIWQRLARSDFNPRLLAKLEPLREKLASRATHGVDILYSDYMKDGESRAENSKILAVHIQQGEKTLDYFARESRQGTYFYDRDGKAPRLTMDRAPFSYTRISSPFSAHRRHPITGRIQAHEGVDLKGRYGTAIHTTGDGIVTYAGWQKGYGRIVIIDHNNGYQTRYAHLSAISTHAGARVKRGQIIGKLGNSGLSTGPHLHFEVRVNGIPRDPITVTLPSYPPLPRREMASWQYYAGVYLETIDELKNNATVKK